MKITIDSEADIEFLKSEYNVKLLATTQKLVIAILEQAEELGDKFALVRIHSDVLSRSYIETPPAFMQHVKKHITYPNIQTYLEEKDGETYLCVRAGVNKKSTTFKSKVRNGLVNKRKCVVDLEDVPSTYRTRPKTLAESLTRELGIPVCSSCKNGVVTWSIKSKKRKKQLTSATR